MARQKVAVICYGERREFPSRKAAMDFFFEGMMCCEGAERERYTTIYCQLKQGATLATDEIY